MALNEIRDISIIATPPNNRLSIRTFVRNWNPDIVREACLRELGRGGQIFYVHNEVRSIQHAAKEISRIVPEANIAVAHGQMPKVQLENVMKNFYLQNFDLLVCSTIIESGIDIPTANTIIIDRASNFGLAQLHQLRGRVGRSHHQAYAYLLVPSKEYLRSDAPPADWKPSKRLISWVWDMSLPHTTLKSAAQAHCSANHKAERSMRSDTRCMLKYSEIPLKP